MGSPDQFRVTSPLAHYGRVPESLLLDPKVSDAACRLYAYLTRWDYRLTGKAFPGEQRTAQDLDWSIRSVQRQLLALEGLGAISRRQGGGGHPLVIHLLADVDSATPELAGLPDLSPSATTDLSVSHDKSVERTYIERELERERHAPSDRGTRCPDPLDVTEAMISWVRGKYPTLDWARETDKFVDYWAAVPGPKGRKLDWEATWRSWMHRAADTIHLKDYSRRPSNQRG